MKHALLFVLLIVPTCGLAQSNQSGDISSGTLGRSQKELTASVPASPPDECQDSGSTHCQAQSARAAYQSADKELNEKYAVFIKKFDGDRELKKKITEAQRTWIAFRDKTCGFENAWRGGIDSISWVRCMNRLTSQRVIDLDSYIWGDDN